MRVQAMQLPYLGDPVDIVIATAMPTDAPVVPGAMSVVSGAFVEAVTGDSSLLGITVQHTVPAEKSQNGQPVTMNVFVNERYIVSMAWNVEEVETT